MHARPTQHAPSTASRIREPLRAVRAALITTARQRHDKPCSPWPKPMTLPSCRSSRWRSRTPCSSAHIRNPALRSDANAPGAITQCAGAKHSGCRPSASNRVRRLINFRLASCAGTRAAPVSSPAGRTDLVAVLETVQYEGVRAGGATGHPVVRGTVGGEQAVGRDEQRQRHRAAIKLGGEVVAGVQRVRVDTGDRDDEARAHAVKEPHRDDGQGHRGDAVPPIRGTLRR